MRCLPQFGEYNGLTVVLSNPSRFDSASKIKPNERDNLLSAGGGQVFNGQCLRPTTNLWQCDVRTKEDNSSLLPNTKCILLLGQDAMHAWLPNSRNNSIGELRGSCYERNGILCIPSFFPQDAADIKNYEAEFNIENQTPLVNDDDIDDDENESVVSDKRQHGKTKRKNFAFWLSRDTAKALAIIKNGGKIPVVEPTAEYIIYPPSDTIVNILLSTKNCFLYFDIETDSELNILCFSFAFDIAKIYVVPCQNHQYQWAYSSLHHIFRALAIAIRDNILVAHNGAAFDFFVLAHKYRIAINKTYDTMLAHHRCYSEIEKSLGHVTSLWTWQPFHKDEGNGRYFTPEDTRRMWAYCGKDVYTMILIHQAIEKHCDKQIGLRESIQQVNSAIRPYLIATLQGIRYDQEKLKETMAENDRLMTQYLRCLDILIGERSMKDIRAGSKTASAIPGSNPQCCKYFHDLLGYDVVARSPKTGKPSLAKKAMYKLRLKYENPCIDLIIAYRELAKESGTLKFEPWKS